MYFSVFNVNEIILSIDLVSFISENNIMVKLDSIFNSFHQNNLQKDQRVKHKIMDQGKVLREYMGAHSLSDSQ